MSELVPREMSGEEIDVFLAEPRHAIIAVNRETGPPQLTPVWYLYENGALYFVVSAQSLKYKLLRRDPRIAVCVDAGHPDARAVLIRGSAERIDARTDWPDNIAWRIARRYYDSDAATKDYLARVGDTMTESLIKVMPERITGLDFN